MSPGPLLLFAVAALVGGTVVGPRFPRLWLAVTLAGIAAGCGAAIMPLAGAPEWEWRSAFRIGGEFLHLRLDALSAMFLLLAGVVSAAGAVYAREYWPDDEHPDSAPRGRAWWSALVLSFGSVLVSSNGLHFLIAWEVFTVCAYFLVTLDRQRREVRAAGWLYLAASHAGMVFLFAFFSMLSARTGGWDLGPQLRTHANLTPLFWLALAGFGVKAGLFPLHIWLPSAHANAPSHVSAVMSGVAIKMGVYGIIRFSGWMPAPPSAGVVVMVLGAVAAILGIAFALAQNDIKRLLAYCSVENIGIIMIGVGGSLFATSHGDAAWGRLALAGALLHVWNHGLFKSLLFLGAGSVLHATGTREMSRLGGLWRNMPWTAALFALASVAICGLPPLNGFVSEWLIYLGLFDAVTTRSAIGAAAAPAALALAIAGALALATFVKAGSVVFLGAARTRTATDAHECGPFMRGAMVALAAGCVSIALIPVFFWPAVSRAVGAWNPTWNSGGLPAPLATLGLVHVSLAAGALVAMAWIISRARNNGLSRAPTWDCGFARPAPRMQYTSGSFAGIATGWFFWILRPERDRRRPHGVFPQTAHLVQRVPETVLERFVTPAGALVMRASTAVRRLQHGRLQSYILYLVAGLAGLAVLVMFGGAR